MERQGFLEVLGRLVGEDARLRPAVVEHEDVGGGAGRQKRRPACVGGDVGGDSHDLAVDAGQVPQVGGCLLELLDVAAVDDEVDAFFSEGFGARTTEPLARRADDAPPPGDAEVHVVLR